MSNFLKEYFENKEVSIEYWRQPIVKVWLDIGGVDLQVLEKKAEKLNELNARGKLREWLLSPNDVHFNSITAERYIIDYLRGRNTEVYDNLFSNDKPQTDAEMLLCSKKIGIEVTTLNPVVADWILIERLPLFFKEEGYKIFNTISINYATEKINEMFELGKIYEYIHDVGISIINSDKHLMKELEIDLRETQRDTACIIWEPNRDSTKPLMLVEELFERTRQSIDKKTKQLGSYDQNILFVGVNNMIMHHPHFMNILDHIGKKKNGDVEDIEKLEKKLRNTLPDNILGVCYFVYSITREEPFFPLRVIWKDEDKTISISL